MKNGCKIVDNKPYCPTCSVILNGTSKDYKLVEDELGDRYIEFTRECLKCYKTFSYILDLSMEAHERFVIEDKELKEYKEG